MLIFPLLQANKWLKPLNAPLIATLIPCIVAGPGDWGFIWLVHNKLPGRLLNFVPSKGGGDFITEGGILL